MNQTMPPIPSNPHIYDFPVPQPKKSRKKLWLILAAVGVGLVLVLAGVLSARSNQASNVGGSGQNSLTLYYRDDKTVYWDSKTMGSDWLEMDKMDFVGQVVWDLKNHVGREKLSQGEWKVTITLDPTLQKNAQDDMRSAETQMKRQRVKNAALIAEDVTNGQIVSWVGKMEGAAEEEATKKVRVGTLALPFTYAMIMNENSSVTADTKYADTRGPLPGYACTKPTPLSDGGNCLYNFDNKFLGPISVRQSLGGLRLVPTVTAALTLPLDDKNGRTKMQTYAESLTTDGTFACYRDEQLNEETACYTSSLFGDGLFAMPKDMIQAYATLANGGKKSPQVTVLKAAQNGKQQYEWRQQSGQQIMKVETAKTITDIMSDPSASYISSHYKDRFMANGTKVGVVMGFEYGATMMSNVQYSSKYAVGVWAVGDSRGIAGTAETAAMPPATTWMRSAH